MRKFWNKFGFDLFVFMAVCMTLMLGTWQLVRLDWKNSLIAEMNQRLLEPIENLDLSSFNIAKMRFRKVLFACVMRTDFSVYLAGQEFDGKSGYNVITPCELPKGDAVLVNRGWVPSNPKNGKPEFKDIEPVMMLVQGVVLDAHLRNSLFTLDSPYKDNLWYVMNVDAMARVLNPEIQKITSATRIKPILVQYFLDEKDAPQAKDALPKILPAKIELYNQHLSYTIMWYGMALAFAVLYVVYRRKAKPETTPAVMRQQRIQRKKTAAKEPAKKATVNVKSSTKRVSKPKK